jgi:methionyl-tRNA formyltransferase
MHEVLPVVTAPDAKDEAGKEANANIMTRIAGRNRLNIAAPDAFPGGLKKILVCIETGTISLYPLS